MLGADDPAADPHDDAGYPYGGSPLFVTPEWFSASREPADDAIDVLAQALREEFEVTTHVRPELSPVLGLHDLAVELDAAAIVVGSTHRGPVGRVLAGEIASGWNIPQDYEAEREERAQETADAARRLLASRVQSTSELIVGDAARELAEASEHLDLLVCGSRGYSAVRSVLLGSVSRQLAHTTACPLLVVPRPAIEEDPRPAASRRT